MPQIMKEATLEAAGRLLSTLDVSSNARMSQCEEGAATTVVASTPRDADRFDLSVGIYEHVAADSGADPPDDTEASPAWLLLRYDAGRRLATQRLDARGRALFRDVPRDCYPYSLHVTERVGESEGPLPFAPRPSTLAASAAVRVEDRGDRSGSDLLELLSDDAALVCTVSRHDEATLELWFESRAPEGPDPEWVRCDLHDNDNGDICHSRIVPLTDARGVREGRCTVPLLDHPPRLTFHTVSPRALSEPEADLIRTAYETADADGRRAWVARLNEAFSLLPAPAAERLGDIVGAAREHGN